VVPIFIQMNSVHVLKGSFVLRFNVILPSTLMSLKWSLSFFPTEALYVLCFPCVLHAPPI
jgi:hypothetical protein